MTNLISIPKSNLFDKQESLPLTLFDRQESILFTKSYSTTELDLQPFMQEAIESEQGKQKSWYQPVFKYIPSSRAATAFIKSQVPASYAESIFQMEEDLTPLSKHTRIYLPIKEGSSEESLLGKQIPRSRTTLSKILSDSELDFSAAAPPLLLRRLLILKLLILISPPSLILRL